MKRTEGKSKELEAIKRARGVSWIGEDDKGGVKESLVKDVVNSIEQTAKDLESGKKKPMGIEELDKLTGLR